MDSLHCGLLNRQRKGPSIQGFSKKINSPCKRPLFLLRPAQTTATLKCGELLQKKPMIVSCLLLFLSIYGGDWPNSPSMFIPRNNSSHRELFRIQSPVIAASLLTIIIIIVRNSSLTTATRNGNDVCSLNIPGYFPRGKEPLSCDARDRGPGWGNFN